METFPVFNVPSILEPTIDHTLAKAAAYRNCAVIGQALMNLLNESWELIQDNDICFAYFEIQYRKMESCVYLIACPNHLLAPGTIGWDFKEKKEMPYGLWICVNGKAEAEKALKDFGTKDFQQNLQKLMQTGFMTPKTEAAKVI
jgi:hypothetical protein